MARGIAALSRVEPRFAEVHSFVGAPPLRRRSGGFEALLRIITDQQISLAAGESIWARTIEHLAPLTPEAMLDATDAQFRAAGQSRGKERTMRALARAIVEESLDLDGVEALGDEEAMVELMGVKGIGPWTAEIYLLTCLGRRDVWPAGDVALQSAAREVFDLAARPSRDKLIEMAESWRPWRAVAARLLWSHYRWARDQ